jgi:hypothetical protein
MAFLSNSCRLLVFKFCSDVRFLVYLYSEVFVNEVFVQYKIEKKSIDSHSVLTQ